MADIYDEQGNPIQLTDEHGNPVQLTDEHGHPMHLTGVAATIVEGVETTDTGDVVVAETVVEGVPLTGTHPHGGAVPPTEAAVHGGVTGVGATRGEHRPLGEQLRGSSSSSSSSSEDDGQGGRRKKKKGLKEKLKEILPGKHKDEHAPQTGSYPVPLSSAAAAPPGHHPHEHEKKGILEKIKEKLPGTHHHNH
ncbi:late embryogenesis abundant protein-like [Rhododendron vialii]|uniref:late embryogenesis abundant protein-like n=1 Tax=Rhododendron vialii TaxID=182163 RepID=UPI00265E3B23|nr:late embryogenesis abundant protein-like [Rhododendron vialii]